MEFIRGPEGHITPDPTEVTDPEQLRRTERAMDLFRGNAERIRYFKNRATELGKNGNDVVITLLDVDDAKGGILADALVPMHDWQQYRDRGETPVARGLADKSAMVGFLGAAGFDYAARELAQSDALMVMVLAADVALILDVEFGE